MTATPNSRLFVACALLASMVSWPLQSSAEILAPALPDMESVDLVTFGSGVLDVRALAQYRGGTEVVIENTNATSGVVYGNQARDLVTGSNLITDGSFAGASGLSTVVQNTGNNVLIQAPVIVNLQVQ